MKASSTGQNIVKGLSAGMAVLFAVWAYYQWNDPDSIPWVAIYAAASIVSLVFVTGKLPLAAPSIIGSVSVLWAAYLATQITYGPPLIAIEEWREMMGLVVVVVWMGVLLLALYRIKKPTPSLEENS